MIKEKLWQKQVQLANGDSPIWRFVNNTNYCSSINIDKEFQVVIDEVKELGYSRHSFIDLRSLLLNENGSYNIDKVKLLVTLAIDKESCSGKVETLAGQAESSGWLYEQNLVEYVNIRSLGINAKRNSFVRCGTFLDFIVFMLQSRSCTYHLAPFNSCMMELLYSPTDMYNILDDIVSEELTHLTFSPEEQLKLAIDFGHLRREKNAFMIDCLPHTAQLSVNYLFKPEQARWISLDSHIINQNKTLFNKGRKIIKQILNGDFDNLDRQEIGQLFSLKESEISKILKHNTHKSKKESKVEIEKLLRKRLVLKTKVVTNKNDKAILRKEASKNWKINKSAENSELIHSKDHKYNCDKIRQIMIDKLGCGYTYKDIQKSETNYKKSIAKSFVDTYYIFNLPVGPWNGGELELIGFDITYKKPVYLSKSFKSPDERLKDVSRNIFGSISRRNFRFDDGQLNKDALDEFINAYYYWVMLGFDALRIDQVDHVCYDDLDRSIFNDVTIQEEYYNRGFAYDTILKEDLKAYIDGLRHLTNNNIAILLEDMMHFSMSDVNNVFCRLEYLNADTVIGHLQFMSKMPQLLIRLKEHNLIRSKLQTGKFIMSTVECHDNNLTFGGTSPVCEGADGIATLRIRLLLCLLGLPYITSQALHGINSNYITDSQMHTSINHKINLNFKAKTKYCVGNKSFKFDNFKHNLFDFIEMNEIKDILKGGIVKIHTKLTENSANELIFFSVHNNSSSFLFFVINASSDTRKDVCLQNIDLDWCNGDRESLYYDLDATYKSKLEPYQKTLELINTDKYKNTLFFGDMPAGEIRVYLL